MNLIKIIATAIIIRTRSNKFNWQVYFLLIMGDGHMNKGKIVGIAYTIMFAILIIVLFICIRLKSILGLSVVIILTLTFLVGRIIMAYCVNSNDEVNDEIIEPIDKKNLLSSQKLLRYATAALAFLSLLTTANGMNSFVFDTPWKSYVASFAVQSILVIFSLLLCRIIVKISILSWALYKKRLVSSFLILFFCMALTVSSVFSFSYIVNNAYKKSWASDREKIIQNYLLDVVYRLREENEYRGNSLLHAIHMTAGNDLIGAIDIIREQEKTDTDNDIVNKINNLTYYEADLEGVNINQNDFYAHYPTRYQAAAEQLYSSYTNWYEKEYREIVHKYNSYIGEINEWKDKPIQNSEILERCNSINREIVGLSKTLVTLKEGIEDWKTSQLREDISDYRTRFQQQTEILYDQLDMLQNDLNEIKNMAEKSIAYDKEDTVSVELDQILSKIYLFGIDEDIQITDLINEVNTLAISSLNNPDHDSDVIQNLVSLKDKLLSYSEYLALKNAINNFIDNRLKITYQIGDVENCKSEDSQSLYIISEPEWRELRNDSFDEFYTMVKSLPNISLIDVASDYEPPDFDPNKVLDEAIIYQRNLLGDLTEFEKAFIYFKYPSYSFMAFFSAFIAVFFDLGSFFTGCFLYTTEYFKNDIRIENNVSTEQSK